MAEALIRPLQPSGLARRQALPDFLDGRGDKRYLVFRINKFHVHTATDEPDLEHRTTPSRAVNPDQDGSRAVPGMAGNQHHIPNKLLAGSGCYESSSEAWNLAASPPSTPRPPSRTARYFRLPRG